MNALPERQNAPRTFEVIVDMLKERIFSGEYGPGDRLPAERELADSLRVGRPAVREAYRALELVGIVEVRTGKQGGAFIAERDRRTVTETLSDLIRLRRIEMADLTEARLVLEKDVVELAVRRIGAEEIARLEACITGAIDRSDTGVTATAENLRFHKLLGEMSGNPILSMMLASMLDLLETVIVAAAPSPRVSKRHAEDHRTILGALRCGGFPRLWTLMESHIVRANAELTRLARKSPLFAHDSLCGREAAPRSREAHPRARWRPRARAGTRAA